MASTRGGQLLKPWDAGTTGKGSVTQTVDDASLANAATSAFESSMEAQFMASLLERLREHPRPWWDGAFMREQWPTQQRFRWFADRPDLRAKITQDLTGLAAGAARSAEPDFQSELIDRVLEAGDVTFDTWDASFTPRDIALHGPRATLWQMFRRRFPWDSPDAGDREMLVWLLERLLEERDGTSIMTPLYVRSAIDVRVWQEHIPLEIRVQVDGRRLRRELEGKAFTCSDELSIVKISRIVEHIPLEHIRGVLDALERVLQGLAEDGDASGTDDDADDKENTEGTSPKRSSRRSRTTA